MVVSREGVGDLAFIDIYNNRCTTIFGHFKDKFKKKRK